MILDTYNRENYKIWARRQDSTITFTRKLRLDSLQNEFIGKDAESVSATIVAFSRQIIKDEVNGGHEQLQS